MCHIVAAAAEAGGGADSLLRRPLYAAHSRGNEADRRPCHFVLIIMPENRMDFHYSAPPSARSWKYRQDRLNNTAFVRGASGSGSACRSTSARVVGTMLKMLSKRDHGFHALTDQSFRVLNKAVTA